jgi:hypothetical protein
MNSWNLKILFTLPHERFLVGWEFYTPSEEYDHYTFSLFLGLITISFNWIL